MKRLQTLFWAWMVTMRSGKLQCTGRRQKNLSRRTLGTRFWHTPSVDVDGNGQFGFPSCELKSIGRSRRDVAQGFGDAKPFPPRPSITLTRRYRLPHVPHWKGAHGEASTFYRRCLPKLSTCAWDFTFANTCI